MMRFMDGPSRLEVVPQGFVGPPCIHLHPDLHPISAKSAIRVQLNEHTWICGLNVAILCAERNVLVLNVSLPTQTNLYYNPTLASFTSSKGGRYSLEELLASY